MPKLQPRSEKIDYLGQKFRTFKCIECNTKIEAMRLDKDRICPKCINKEYFEESIENESNF